MTFKPTCPFSASLLLPLHPEDVDSALYILLHPFFSLSFLYLHPPAPAQHCLTSTLLCPHRTPFFRLSFIIGPPAYYRSPKLTLLSLLLGWCLQVENWRERFLRGLGTRMNWVSLEELLCSLIWCKLCNQQCCPFGMACWEPNPFRILKACLIFRNIFLEIFLQNSTKMYRILSRYWNTNLSLILVSFSLLPSDFLFL